LLAFDPIYNSVPAIGRELMIARFDLDVTDPEWALGFTFDIVLRGPTATPMERRE
jgi:protocatechuate 3,4-dioxygenase beta subunit